MKRPHEPRGASRKLEYSVLAVGLASALALGWVAWRTGADVGARGELAAAELVREVAGLVQAEWESLLAEPDPPARGRGRSFNWSPGERVAAPVRSFVDRSPESREPDTLDLILNAAAELERDASKVGEALTMVREALDRIPQGEGRAEALLRSIQLACRLGECELALESWERARNELAPEVVRGNTSYLLLAGLAAAPCLDPEQRSGLQLEWAGRWASDGWGLPAQSPRLVWGDSDGEGHVDGPGLEPSPARVALWRRLEALDSDHSLDALWTEIEERRARRALASQLGELPPADPQGLWTVSGSQERPFLSRQTSDGSMAGIFVDPDDLVSALAQRVELPLGFVLDTSVAGDGEGELVRERTALAGDVIGFRLRHRDRGSLVRSERRRWMGLRAALVALALFTAGAAFFAARAMRRERRLAELKSAFVAGVSHDLRTPLASILLLAENLESGNIDTETARTRYYPAIRREASRLRRLVDDALDFSRLERGESVRVVRESCEMADLAEDLRAEASERAEAAGASLEFAARDMQGEGWLDAFALRRAVWNLVDNALEHSGSSEVELSLAREQNELRVVVRDHGRGVPPELAERVFEPYASFAGMHNSARGGTGLGLAIVRAIARAHGGEARLEPKVDPSGARFELRLDLSEEGMDGAMS